jgi:NitT/TauT family transport system permease protein
VVCEFLVKTRILSPVSFASPLEIIISVPELFFEMKFYNDIFATITRACLSLVIGFPFGILIAFTLNSIGDARRPGELLLDFIRSIPVTALIPVFISIFGIGDKSKIIIGGFSVSLITAITVWVGIKEQQVNIKTILNLYSPNGVKKFFYVTIPYALPSVVGALRLSVSSALVIIIVSEMFIGTNLGIGKVINDMSYTDNRGIQFAAIICAGIIGYLLNLVIERIKIIVINKLFF